MKHVLPILLFLTGLGSAAQTALYNDGSIRIHSEGQIGFHANFINNGIFDENLGLAGFYGNTALTISGTVVPVFFDVELANDMGILLQQSLDNSNNTNFISGDFRTPRSQNGIAYTFLEDAFYVGDANMSKVDGYAQIVNQQNFTFPVGSEEQLRPLILNSQDINPTAQCAYFLENPNFPQSFDTPFESERKTRDLGAISTTEFWYLEGTVPSTISISWNIDSNLELITEDPAGIIPVGWKKETRRWESLAGEDTAVGDLEQGFITSAVFIPDDYEVITFGSLPEPPQFISLDNYLVTPNGDGINDSLILNELENAPNNEVHIFDRFGIKVFQQENYTNEFTGFSNKGNVFLNEDKGLPAGVYFYVVYLKDLDIDLQGFLYLAR
ncbi:MAG: gliding motility-associated C-terminal domain-containing protein [Bacteroidota bacterium]